ncbi:Uncharacterised protein [Zhongshania aliphaticivorans]|uniref:MAPEG family protein n=1 Tax=Zhongshania aliphaticivorans TaxID=1470434 RepID=A0A5S9PJF2_9GAMM|nr:MAPEG family protein [Zhongshania aliphaticivorans]CAA0103946.1 Uncharacterised protein [Zhongshania aliphaticivorans]
MNVALLCIGLLGALCIGMGIAVSMNRIRQKQGAGCPSDPKDQLHKYIRAHANTVEFAPVLMVLMYILSQSQMSAWVLWSIILVTVSRFVLVAGLIFPRTMSRPNPLRQIGAMGTYVFGLALCIAVLMLA